MIKIYSIIAIVVGLALSSCGGGGGGGEAFFGGIWRVLAAPTVNNCTFDFVNVVDTNFTVNHAGEQVAMTVETNGQVITGEYSGVVTGDDSFSVSQSRRLPCSGGAEADVITVINFTSISGDTANVEITEQSRCDGSLLLCRVTWDGTGDRE